MEYNRSTMSTWKIDKAWALYVFGNVLVGTEVSQYDGHAIIGM